MCSQSRLNWFLLNVSTIQEDILRSPENLSECCAEYILSRSEEIAIQDQQSEHELATQVANIITHQQFILYYLPHTHYLPYYHVCGVSVHFIFLQFLFVVMFSHIVLFQIALLSCLITAQVTRVYYSLMHSSFMPCKITL